MIRLIEPDQVFHIQAMLFAQYLNTRKHVGQKQALDIAKRIELAQVMVRADAVGLIILPRVLQTALCYAYSEIYRRRPKAQGLLK